MEQQMNERNAGLTADPLFVGATRPPMRWGVTYSALLFNMVFTLEAFLLTKNLLTAALPADSRCLRAAVRPRCAVLRSVLLWGRTRLPALSGKPSGLEGEQLQPTSIDLPNRRWATRRRPALK